MVGPGKWNKTGRYDCIVVGGGRNGLVTAAYLATAEVDPRENRTPMKSPTPLNAGEFSPGRYG